MVLLSQMTAKYRPMFIHDIINLGTMVIRMDHIRDNVVMRR